MRGQRPLILEGGLLLPSLCACDGSDRPCFTFHLAKLFSGLVSTITLKSRNNNGALGFFRPLRQQEICFKTSSERRTSPIFMPMPMSLLESPLRLGSPFEYSPWFHPYPCRCRARCHDSTTESPLESTPTESPLESMRSTTKLLQDFNEKNVRAQFELKSLMLNTIEGPARFHGRRNSRVQHRRAHHRSQSLFLRLPGCAWRDDRLFIFPVKSS